MQREWEKKINRPANELRNWESEIKIGKMCAMTERTREEQKMTTVEAWRFLMKLKFYNHSNVSSYYFVVQQIPSADMMKCLGYRSFFFATTWFISLRWWREAQIALRKGIRNSLSKQQTSSFLRKLRFVVHSIRFANDRINKYQKNFARSKSRKSQKFVKIHESMRQHSKNKTFLKFYAANGLKQKQKKTQK